MGHYLDHLVRALAQIDTENEYTLFYVSGRADPAQIVRIPQSNFRTRLLRIPNPAFVRIFRDGSLPYRVMRSVSRGYDLVHEPGFEPLPLAPRLVLTIHDLNWFSQPENLSPVGMTPIQQRLHDSAHNAAQIMADSEYTRQDVIARLRVPPEKVHTVYLGVDPDSFEIDPELAARELLSLGIMKPFVLSLGDVIHGKNNISAVRGWARLPPSLRTEYQFVIAGVLGNAVEELKAEIIALDLHDSVLMPGYVSDNGRRALMKSASALVFPSIYEGFGLPPLEAMVCGVPTISALSSSIPEVVGDAGLLVQEYLEPEAWTEGMEKILTDQDLRQTYIALGHKRAERFRWENTARETLRIYELAARS